MLTNLYKKSWLWQSVMLLLGLGTWQQAQAQCPVSASCTPSAATNTSIPGTGIFTVTLNTLSNTTGGASQGYGNFACTVGTSLLKSSPYTLSVTTGSAENLRVWIDYDNNGTFDPTAELVLSSNNKSTHSGTVTVPTTAVAATPLRMRVSSDLITATIPTPCSSPVYSQVEDYYIIATENAQPPLAAFGVQGTPNTCDGVVQFLDQSQNSPTSWFWNFGDNSNSTDQSPLHVYNQAGNYTVKLVVSSANGIDSVIKENYIVFNDTVPRLASCNPITLSACCGYGITNFTFNTITQASAAGTAGYENFTCARRTYVYEGMSYPVSVTTSQNDAQDTRIFIDYNDDGIFTSDELVYQSLSSTGNVTGNILIAASAVKNKALRMRVWSDYAGATFADGACTNPSKGQAEDYTVIVLPNAFPPVANFTVSSQPCNATFTFSNISQNPVDSSFWSFGDGSTLATNSLANITHTYTTSGTYDVQLIVKSPYGTDTLQKVGAVIYVTAPIASNCTAPVALQFSGLGIRQVTFNTIDNATGNSTEGYGDFTCTNATQVYSGNIYPLQVRSNSTSIQEYVSAWIDYNNDGTFASSEQVMAASGVMYNNPVTELVTIPSNVVFNQNLRMRVVSNYQSPSACASGSGGPSGQFFGQTEDYGVIILPNTMPPVSDYYITSITTCNTLEFTDMSTNVPTSWLWDFGDGTTSTVKNPTHTYSNTVQTDYTVSLTASNAYGSDTFTQVVSVAASQGLLLASCKPASFSPQNYEMGIYNVTLAGINKTSFGAALEGYQDFACDERAQVTAGNTYNISVTTGSTYGEQVKVFIDYNNDGTFATSELAFTYTDNNTPVNPKIGTITIPNTAVGLTALRMRVFSDYYTQTISTACQNSNFSQVEDYSVYVQPNGQLPDAAFTSAAVSTCSRVYQFSDVSSNQPSTWTWNFGDGTTSTMANPSHTFASAGTYPVKLKVTNAAGVDSITQSVTVATTATSTMLAAPCKPTTAQPQGNTIGIFNVQLSTINNTTNGSIDSYKDYTCTQAATLTAGTAYTLSVRVSTTVQQNIRAWIDYNYDGVFDNTTELVMTKNNVIGTQTQTITPSGTAVTGQALRMRVASDASSVAWTGLPCASPMNGQVEDYAVTVVSNTQAVQAGFTVSNAGICLSETIAFADTSKNIPTSWTWDFGDGSTSTLQNPTYTYAAVGTYTVSLTVTNAFGVSSAIQTVTVYPSITLTAISCTPNSTAPNASTGIFSVQFGNINKTSVGSTDQYQNYACSAHTDLTMSMATPITIKTGTSQNESVRVWIDYNNNGSYETNENVFNSINKLTNHAGNITVPTTAVTGQYLRMRVASEVAATTGGINSACQNRTSGQVEDYAVRVQLVGVKSKLLTQKLQVYPNPSVGEFKLNLTLDKQTKATVSVTNLLGQEVYNQQIEAEKELNHTVRLQRTAGIYLVKVATEEGYAIEKVVVE
ncbi:Por secretion system C-terminal sorting domain-containing protein [Flexibacter flexilis DSM 6793]|uniref:Por secretion system C-terminal sorting domain-containing protein n=1 Tax=Flexibacter flexilis DSM 6793 TaxID=927664 RepID=A0A1I1KTK2_9BACT|nr:GEVED domain-containing protein [Flexibacter flexilis]SFC60780.1 Por secretion system C-terminal sorting domain-containing protein [Flexibacter flexilis DSM 6793]